MMNRQRIIHFLFLACLLSLGPSQRDPEPVPEIEKAYERLLAADHWRDAAKARDELAGHGEKVVPLAIEGTHNKKRIVRQYCYEILRGFPKNREAVDAIIEGLSDEDGLISYSCAFYLGTHRVKRAAKSLTACTADASKDSKTRYAVAKSLAELGDTSILRMLYLGLGSDDAYTRYLANIGMKTLTGKDLTDFGYKSPWEGAPPVSGLAVWRPLIGSSNVIHMAEAKAERCNAVVAFLKWLKADRPELFSKFDDRPEGERKYEQLPADESAADRG